MKVRGEIMAYYSFKSFIEGLDGKTHNECRDIANDEYAKIKYELYYGKESKKDKINGLPDYFRSIRGLLDFLLTKRIPEEFEHNMFKPVAENLVKQGHWGTEILELFK